jgi:hypothetical protein
MFILGFIVTAGLTLYFLVKPPYPAPQTESIMPHQLDAPISYGFEAKLNA